VQVADATQHGLFGRCRMFDHQGRVFGGQCRQRLGDLLVVGAAFRLYRQAEHRFGKCHRLEVDMAVFLGVVQYVVEVDFVDLGHGTDVAGDAATDFDMFLALQLEQVANLERLARVTDVELGLLGDRALVDAENAELAGKRVGSDLEHVRQRVLGRVGFGREVLWILLADIKRRRVALGRVGHQFDDDVEQLLHPGAGTRRDEADRDQVALTERLLERVVQLFRSEFLPLFQVEFHQFLIDLDHLVDQRFMGLGHRREIRITGRIEKTVDHAVAIVCWQVDRQDLVAEILLQPGQQAGQGGTLAVDLVDDDETAEFAFGGAFEHPPGGPVDAGVGVDHHRRGLDRLERTEGMTDEVGISRGVDQVDVSILDIAVGHRRGERVTVAFLFGFEIANGGATLDLTRGVDRPGLVQQGLDQRRLA